MSISVKGMGKNQLQSGQENMGDSLLLSHCSLLRNYRPKPVCGIFVMKEKPLVGSPFFRALPSDHIPMATNYVNVLFSIRSLPPMMTIMDNALAVKKMDKLYQ
jgi:hypothetical protein